MSRHLRINNRGELTEEADVPEVSPSEESTNVNHPAHYASGSIECIDAMLSAFGKEAVATFCKLNAFKYNWRSEQKGGNEDIQKAIWYLNKYLELNK